METKAEVETVDWSMEGVWNTSLIRPERDMRDRSYLWASEVGKPLADLWLKWQKITPTNPPNDRSKRKFMAGDVWEFIIGLILQQSGLVIEAQAEIWTEFELKVKGKCDYIAGGTPDFDKALQDIMQIGFPEKMQGMANDVVLGLKRLYGGKALEPMALEVKSVSSFMMDKVEKTGLPSRDHVFQDAHYIIGRNMKKGMIVYVCRDDCRMKEFLILNNEETLADYRREVKRVAEVITQDEMPDKEPLILFDPDMGKFSKNFAVEYSGYLTYLYGFETPEKYREEVDSKIARWNRVLKRIAAGATITKKNQEVIDEIKKEWGNPDELVDFIDPKAAEEAVEETPE